MVPYPGKKNFRLTWLIIIFCVIACLIVAYKFISPTKKQFIPTVSGNSQKLTPVIRQHPVQPTTTVQAIVSTNNIYYRPAKKKYTKIRLASITEKDLQKRIAIDNNDFTTSNRPITKANSIALLDSFYKSIAKQPVNFLIQPQQDTVLNLPEGTIISVPANTWVYTNGHPVTEPVVFSVTEFYDKGSMICNRLSTISNGEPLVTGGMLHLTAKDVSCNEIIIKRNSSIDIQMPYKNRDEKMQLFLPAKVANTLAGQTDSTSFQMLNSLEWTGAGQWQARMPVPKVYVLNWTQEPTIQYSDEMKVVYLIDQNCELSNQEIKDELKKRYPWYANIKVRRAWKHPIRLFSKWKPATFGEKEEMLLTKAKKLKLVTPKEEEVSLKQFQENLKQFRNDSVRLAAMAQIQNKYGFKVSNLGFINCDRFLNDSRPKVLYTINHSDSSEKMFVHRLFFHSINSIMAPYWDDEATFKNIPAGEKVTLVSVGVINNETVTSFKTFTTDNTSPLLKLNYQPTEPTTFKKELQSILDNFKQ